MTNIDLNEVNKKIAKFEGMAVYKDRIVGGLKRGRPTGFGSKVLYTTSLDALVPVWEKLCMNGGWFNINRHGLDHYQVALIATQVHDSENPWESADSRTIQEAAALATYKCILEMEKER